MKSPSAAIKPLSTVPLLSALLMFFSCGGNRQEASLTAEAEATDSSIVRIAVMPTLDCLPVFVASEHGFFDRRNVRVSLKTFQSQMDIDTAMTGGSVQCAVTDLVRHWRLRSQGMKGGHVFATDAKWLLLTSRSSRIRQLHQLDDKMLAMTRYSATDLLADLAVEQSGLASERVYRIQVNDLRVRLEMLQNSIMDAMFLPEPQATLARIQKNTVLIDTDSLHIRLGCMAFFTDDATEKAIVEAINEAADSLNTRGIEAYADIAMHRLAATEQMIDSLKTHTKFNHLTPPSPADTLRVDQWWTKRNAETQYVEKRYIQ